MKFTVITCTYNAATVLQRTLDSVRAQTWGDLEHLIIDGASRDDTVAMAEAYCRECRDDDDGHEIVIVSEPDRGLYDAMNKGIARATGDYIVFLNAGDTLPDADTLEAVASYVADGEPLPAVLYGDTDIVDADGHFLRHRRLSPPDRLTWRSFRHGMLVCHQAFYARTDIARDTPYDLHYRYSADVDWCIRIMREGTRRHLALRRVPHIVAHFLDGGMTTANHRASLGERFRIMVRHYGLVTTLVMHAWFAIRKHLQK